jgi:TolB protein
MTAGAPALAAAHPARCDEGRIVFTRAGDDGSPTVFSTDPCTGAVTRIAAGHHATLSRDGRLLAYDSIPDGQHTTDVFVSRPDGTGARDVTNSPGTNDLEPAFSPDGRSLAYSTGTDGVRDAQIATQDLRGGAARVITDLPSGQEAFDPSWSPSGRRIVFDTLSRGPSYVWIVRTDGRDLQRITSDADDACQPDWGPDGLIAYTGGCDQLQSHLFLRTRGGHRVRQLTTDADGGSSQKPAFSPDGRSLTFSRFDANFDDGDVWRLDLRTGAETDVVSGPTFDFWSDWGPDPAPHG